MQLIKEIQIENFQSHNSTTLNLSPGLNVITGPSDSGKSSIIRALRWVLYNEPLGDDFIQVGTNQCRVGILLDNGYRVIRERSNKVNRYIVIDNNGEKEIYTGFGTNVPQEVIEAHQMLKVALDNDTETTLNLDYQLAGPFLLNDSGFTKAKAIGQLTGVHIIDSAIKDVAIDLRRARGKKKNELAEIDKIDEKITDYEDLPQLKEEIERKERLFKEIKMVNEKLNTYQQLKKEWEELNKEKVKIQKILDKLNQLEKIESLYTEINNQQEELFKLKELYKEWKQVNQEIKNLNQLLKELQNLNKVEDHYRQMQQLYNQIKDLTNLDNELKKVNKRFKVNQSGLNKTKKLPEVKKLIEDITDTKEDYYNLKRINQEFQKVNQELNLKQKIMNKLPKEEQIQSKVTKIKQIKEELVSLKKLNMSWKENKEKLQKGNVFIKDIEEELEIKLKKYKNKLKELNRCPVCLSQIEDNILDRIIDNYRLGGIKE
ncbi:AAA family ATPase [Selenihalanaerobacter shriftii]|uniref:Nuclease SbcCD subunit C n=1 Tax=Selenihalanaerobacter shriftii TaxID=142842 RepID=A0A1T4JLZ9_9FIRM|nr:AAA family ATPase [Selenihalanaerobacter shriftii]SJZ31209.1 exonuclease SbcC [Selenihalanaerobacter shriftii]